MAASTPWPTAAVVAVVALTRITSTRSFRVHTAMILVLVEAEEATSPTAVLVEIQFGTMAALKIFMQAVAAAAFGMRVGAAGAWC